MDGESEVERSFGVHKMGFIFTKKRTGAFLKLFIVEVLRNAIRSNNEFWGGTKIRFAHMF